MVDVAEQEGDRGPLAGLQDFSLQALLEVAMVVEAREGIVTASTSA